MEMDAVPAALRLRLGPDATAGLFELLARSHEEARESVIAACTERFERRLVEEVFGMRVQLAHVESGLRLEITHLESGLRQEIARFGAELRQEIAQSTAGLRQEIARSVGELRQEIAAGRVELFKWCFLFWIGQVLAIGGLMGVMLRLAR